MLPRILNREDPEVSRMVAERFEAEGMRVLVNHEAKAFRVENGEKVLIAVHDGREVRIAFDQVLVAVGRVANTDGYGLEELGIPGDAGADRGNQRVPADAATPTSTPAATSRVRTSSPTPRRTRRGTRRSTRSSAA